MKAIQLSSSNNKGGVLKTTTTLNAGQVMHNMGLKVLLVDLDTQCNLTSSLMGRDFSPEAGATSAALFDKDSRTKVRHLIVKTPGGPDLIPGRATDIFSVERGLDDVGDALNGAVIPSIEKAMKTKDKAESARLLKAALEELRAIGDSNSEWTTILKRRISEVAGDYDYIIYDLPPSVSRVPRCAWAASDYLLIPIADYLSLMGTWNLVNHMVEIKKEINQDLRFIFFFTKVPVGANQSGTFIGKEHRLLGAQLKAVIEENEGLASVSTLLSNFIRFSREVDASHMAGEAMVNFSKQHGVTEDYIALTNEIIEVTKR